MGNKDEIKVLLEKIKGDLSSLAGSIEEFVKKQEVSDDDINGFIKYLNRELNNIKDAIPALESAAK
ncbi:hypothetical protein KY304_00905 [Candidatus Woesearchaeota archaeon]|nr:hypothetical protein [Candidatus Woesearchaeota archaeon]MBW2978652.1 hypothetical protein [Candidatus Woesearchaeota archaeon]